MTTMKMTMMSRAKQYVQELSIQHFYVTMVRWCSSRVQLGQQYNSLVTSTTGRGEKKKKAAIPLRSTRGRHATLGKVA